MTSVLKPVMAVLWSPVDFPGAPEGVMPYRRRKVRLK
jgi:hypothetical protein